MSPEYISCRERHAEESVNVEVVVAGDMCASATLVVSVDGVFATGGTGSGDDLWPLTTVSVLRLLELFVHDTDIGRVATEYERLKESAGASVEAAAGITASVVEIHLGRGRLVVCDSVARKTESVVDLSLRSSKGFLIGIARAYGVSLAIDCEWRFEDDWALLRDRGLLTSLPGAIDWGELRRHRPFCGDFGFCRGTPVDRYYLSRFVAEVRSEIRGDVVEIGGRQHNERRYGLDDVRQYRCIDIEAKCGADIVGDVHDTDLLPAECADVLLAFNVLEHCAEPWKVVANMRQWLRVGGRAVCMVPNAQRLHRMPRDYWRPMPDGFSHLFRSFRRQRLYVYGNVVTYLAATLGIAIEELEPHERDRRHLDYPVASCIVAEK